MSMNDYAVLIQQIYPDTEGVRLMELNRERNTAYCAAHGFDYWHRIENSLPDTDPLKGSWAKIELIRRGLEAGYKSVVWLDADTLIRDMDTDLRDAITPGHISACWHRIPQLHHWNVGALYLSNTERVRAFVAEWLTYYPGINDGWLEQGVFNRMAMHSDIVLTASDRWNATINFTEVPDAVVLGYHGAGDTKQRYELMKEVLTELENHAKETA